LPALDGGLKKARKIMKRIKACPRKMSKTPGKKKVRDVDTGVRTRDSSESKENLESVRKKK